MGLDLSHTCLSLPHIYQMSLEVKANHYVCRKWSWRFYLLAACYSCDGDERAVTNWRFPQRWQVLPYCSIAKYGFDTDNAGFWECSQYAHHERQLPWRVISKQRSSTLPFLSAAYDIITGWLSLFQYWITPRHSQSKQWQEVGISQRLSQMSHYTDILCNRQWSIGYCNSYMARDVKIYTRQTPYTYSMVAVHTCRLT